MAIKVLAAAFLILITLAANFSCTAEMRKTSVTAKMDADNNLIFHIQGSVEGNGKVMVEYWSDGTGPFITESVATAGTRFSLQLMRLRAETNYNFKVFLVKSRNSPELQYEGTFTTGPLPKGLQGAKFDLVQGKHTYELNLLDFNDADFKGIVIIDADGKVVWYYQHDRQVFAIAQRKITKWYLTRTAWLSAIQ